MRNPIVAIMAACACLLYAESGIVFEQAEHIMIRDGRISLGHLPRTVFEDEFNLENWRIAYNRNGALSAVNRELAGRRGLILTRDPDAPEDTAFELRSRAFRVNAGTDFSVEVLATGNWAMHFAKAAALEEGTLQPEEDNDSHGFFGGMELPPKYKADTSISHSPMACRLALRWLDKRGAELAAVPLEFKRLPETLMLAKATGTVPPKAAFAQILVGAESPDFTENSFLMLLKATFSTSDGRLYPTGNLVSRPFPIQKLGSVVEWDASTPDKTSVFLQLSSTDDPEKGEWTTFTGPGMDPRRAYTKSGEALSAFPIDHQWLRYKVFLRGYGKKSPVIKRIKIGELVHEGWSGVDPTPPTITMENPLRMEDPSATLSFRIADDSQIEWRTLEMRIDGTDVSASVTREGNRISYTPKAPFSSSHRDFEKLESWDCSDRNLLLEKKALAGGGLRVARKGGKADTFFQLQSPGISVLPFETYVFTCEARSNMALQKEKSSRIRLSFMDNAGNEVASEEAICLPATEKWTMLQCGALAPLKAAYATVSISVEEDMFDGRYVEFREARLAGRRGQGQIDGPNMHIVSVLVADMAGNVCQRNFPVLFSKILPGGSTLNEKGRLTRNGGVYAPLALANLWLTSGMEATEFIDLRRNGFNCAIPLEGTSAADMDNFIKAASRNGVAAVIQLRSKSAGEIIKTVAQMQDKNAVIGWLLDEKLFAKEESEEIIELMETIKGLAPGQPIILKGKLQDAKLQALIPVTDIFMPVIEQDEEVYSAIFAAFKAGCKAVFPVLRLEESRPDLFYRAGAAFLCGACGLAIDCENPEIRGEVFSTSEKLGRVLPILTAGEAAHGQIKADGNRKKPLFAAKRHANKDYLICYNIDEKNAKVSFTVDDCDEARRVLEDSSIPVGGRHFTDHLLPGQLRIYELGRLFE